MKHGWEAFLDGDAGGLEDEECRQHDVAYERAADDTTLLVHPVNHHRHVHHNTETQPAVLQLSSFSSLFVCNNMQLNFCIMSR